MASVYEIRLKASTLEALKAAREAVRARMGTRNVGETLASLSPADAGALANDLLALMDAIDAVTTRAKAAD